jgi:hypothetical protein
MFFACPGLKIRGKWVGICNALQCVTFGAVLKKVRLKKGLNLSSIPF